MNRNSGSIIGTIFNIFGWMFFGIFKLTWLIFVAILGMFVGTYRNGRK